jgi:hypothetical protein
VPKLPDFPTAITAGGQLTAHLTDAAHYGITLLLATGSDAHVTGLRAVGAEQNMILDEKGLRRGGKVVAAATEEVIYKALGMQTIPPELREGRDEIARALAGTLPELVTGFRSRSHHFPRGPRRSGAWSTQHCPAVTDVRLLLKGPWPLAAFASD